MGPDKREFLVYKKVVCDTSDFFRAACEKPWKEAADKIISLPEVGTVEFLIYLGWLHTGKIDAREEPDSKPYNKLELAENIRKTYNPLIKAYAFGDMVQDLSFRNAIADVARNILEYPGVLPDTHQLEALYSRLPRPTKMSRLFVDAWVTGDYSKAPFTDFIPYFPPAFVAEVADVCVAEREMKRKDRIPEYRPKCFYHDHKKASNGCS